MTTHSSILAWRIVSQIPVKENLAGPAWLGCPSGISSAKAREEGHVAYRATTFRLGVVVNRYSKAGNVGFASGSVVKNLPACIFKVFISNPLTF